MLRKSIFAATIMVVANVGSAGAQTTYGSDGPLGAALDSSFAASTLRSAIFRASSPTSRVRSFRFPRDGC